MSEPATQVALLRALYDAAVAAAHPSVCLPPHLPAVPPGGRIAVFGAGKAAAAMAVAVEDHYLAADWDGRTDPIFGFVTTRHGSYLPTRCLAVLEAGHPVPDANSWFAASRTMADAERISATNIVLVLMSGGASALWSAPVGGITLQDKMALTRQLLKSGATISEINTVRRHLSYIKGGNLLSATRDRGHRATYPHVLTLAISDVPGDDPAAIGSGPTVADPTTLADARAIITRYAITPSDRIAAALNDPFNETVKPESEYLRKSAYHIVAAPKQSLAVAADLAQKAGYRPVILGDALEGEARAVGRAHAKLALEARSHGEKVAILSGGEFTVTVTGTGSGGPNQEYALGLTLGLDGAPGIHALAADTDGIDGGGGNATDPAGAIVTPDTLARSRSRHIDAAGSLANNDSTAFFRAVDGLVEVGPTQTNVNDFRVILVDP